MNLQKERGKSKNKIIIFYSAMLLYCIYFAREIIILFVSPLDLIKNGWIIIIAGMLIIYPLVYFLVTFKNYFKSPYAVMNFQDLEVLPYELNQANKLIQEAFIGSNHLFIRNMFYFRVIPLKKVSYVFPSLELKRAGSAVIKTKMEKMYVGIRSMSFKSSLHVFDTIVTCAPNVLIKRFSNFKEVKKICEEFDRQPSQREEGSFSKTQKRKQIDSFTVQENISELGFWYADIKRGVIGSLFSVSLIIMLLISLSRFIFILELPRTFYMVALILYIVLYYTILFRLFERKGTLTIDETSKVSIQFNRKSYCFNLYEIEEVRYLGNRLVIFLKSNKKLVLWEPIYYRNCSGIYEIYKRLNRQ